LSLWSVLSISIHLVLHSTNQSINHIYAAKLAFKAGKPTNKQICNCVNNQQLQNMGKLEALGQCIPPPRHVLPVLHYRPGS